MTTEDIYRTFTPDLEVRSGGDGRTIVGIAVPYGKPVRIDPELTEQFRSGAFNHQLKAAHRVRFTREHLALGGTLIGATKLLRNDAAGLYGEWRASKTAIGDETIELVRDGALREFSIGFREVHNRRLPSGAIERTRANLFEVAITMQGAYGEAAMVEAVRSAELVGEHGPELHHCPSCGGPTERLDQARQILAGLPILPA